MIERSESELRGRLNADGAFAVFLYTPLCGTCKVGSRMLDVVGTMRPDFAVLQANVNAMPKLIQEWRVESVPCLIHLDGGAVVRKLYAFESVENVYRFLQPLFPEPN